jgi:hypothetical protein
MVLKFEYLRHLVACVDTFSRTQVTELGYDGRQQYDMSNLYIYCYGMERISPLVSF